MCSYDKQVPAEIIDVYSSGKIDIIKALEVQDRKPAINSKSQQVVGRLAAKMEANKL